MKKNRLKITLTALLLTASVITACLIIPSSAEGTDAKVQSYEEQIDDLNRKRDEVQAKIDQANSEMGSAVEYKKSIDEALEINYSKKVVAQNMIAELDVKIADKKAEKVRQEAIIKERKNQFLKRMVSIADSGSISYLELILSAESL